MKLARTINGYPVKDFDPYEMQASTALAEQQLQEEIALLKIQERLYWEHVNQHAREITRVARLATQVSQAIQRLQKLQFNKAP